MFLIAQCYTNEENMIFMDGDILELLPLSYDFLQILILILSMKLYRNYSFLLDPLTDL